MMMIAGSAVAAINPRILINVQLIFFGINGQNREKEYEFTRRNTDLR